MCKEMSGARTESRDTKLPAVHISRHLAVSTIDRFPLCFCVRYRQPLEVSALEFAARYAFLPSPSHCNFANSDSENLMNDVVPFSTTATMMLRLPILSRGYDDGLVLRGLPLGFGASPKGR